MVFSLRYHQRLFSPPPAMKLLSSSSAHTTSPSAISPHSADDHRTAPPLSITSTDSPPPAVAFSDYQRLFTSQRSEMTTSPVLLDLVEGSIPDDLIPTGTYYLAGPGIFSDDDGSTVHPLDGHGYLRAFRFGGGGTVWYSARYVTTEALREERDERTGRWRFKQRGAFSVLRRGKRVGNLKVMKNVANTSVVSWGGRLLCLWEGGQPYEIDPLSLDTLGQLDLVGAEQDRGRESAETGGGAAGNFVFDWTSNFMARLLKHVLLGVLKIQGQRTLAHYKVDPKRKRLLMVSCNTEDLLFPPSHLTFYEFDSQYELKNKKEFIIPDHIMIHDWGFTENYYLLVINRIKLRSPKLLLAVSGFEPVVNALDLNPANPSTPIYLLPRFSSDAANQRDWRVPVEVPAQLWTLHVGNTFEEIDGAGNLNIHLQLSVCSYKWFNFQKFLGYNWHTGKIEPSFMNLAKNKEQLLPHVVQVSIELDAEGKYSTSSVANVSDQWRRPGDFPSINPHFSVKKNTYIYQASASSDRTFLPFHWTAL